jgi:hypothetical protein
MGNTNSVHKISFKQMQTIIQNKDYIIINTLSPDLQNCLIINTLNASQEVSIINNLIKTNKERIIIIYGKNCIDESLIKKYTQLLNLGFKNINVYIGGLFEWLTLQDIYGSDLFPTTNIEKDFLKYSP